MRAQTSLPALGFALLVLTGVLVFSVAIADGALLSADRKPLERQAAVDLSNRLVSADARVTDRRNVVERSAVTQVDGRRLRTQYGLRSDADASVTLDGNVIATTGDTDGGTEITRLVLVRSVTERTLTPRFTGGNSVTLPRRTRNATLTIRPGRTTTVTSVRANGRVVLHNDSGLRGPAEVTLSPYRTVTFRFEASGPLDSGDVIIDYYPATTEKARLGVTVDG